MARPILFFTLSAILSVATFYFKSEHSFDMHLVIPVGLYFILAFLFAFRPKVELKQKLQFTGLALLVWLVLFGVSFNLLVLFIAPVAGGLGAWLIVILSKKYLAINFKNASPVIIAGVVAALLGIGFMILTKKQVSLALKAGVITGIWQIGVGIFLARELRKNISSF